MNKTKKAILFGCILGDGYLQKTGKKNARLRLEHSEKQKDYLLWKIKQFPELLQGTPKLYIRYNHKFSKTYHYLRIQSHASPVLGKFRSLFYFKGKKVIPKNLIELVNHPLTLAVWYMDDGYYYKRDNQAYLYLSELTKTELEIVQETLLTNFQLHTIPKYKYNKRGIELLFPVKETKKLFSIINQYIINSMKYKTPFDPVSTEA